MSLWTQTTHRTTVMELRRRTCEDGSIGLNLWSSKQEKWTALSKPTTRNLRDCYREDSDPKRQALVAWLYCPMQPTGGWPNQHQSEYPARPKLTRQVGGHDDKASPPWEGQWSLFVSPLKATRCKSIRDLGQMRYSLCHIVCNTSMNMAQA